MRTQLLTSMVVVLSLLGGCSSWKEKWDDDNPNATVDEIFNEAKAELEDENWNRAIDLYRRLEARFPYGRHAEQAQLDVAYAYHKNEEPGLATAAADRFIKLHPTSPAIDYAYYIKGLASFNEKEGIWGHISGQDDLSDRDPESAIQAYETFKELYTRFPDSRYALDARQRATYLYNSLARHEIRVANYYATREAWVAVANRAKTVLEEYQNAPAAEDALGLLIEAYREMGLPELATDAERVLALNYPGSRYLEMNRGENKGWLSKIIPW